MRNSNKSAGEPVSTSSSAAPDGEPVQATGASAPEWLSPLLHEIAHYALNARAVLGHMIDGQHDDDGCSLNVAASSLITMAGMLADKGLLQIGEPGVQGGMNAWLVSPVLGQALKQDGAVQ